MSHTLFKAALALALAVPILSASPRGQVTLQSVAQQVRDHHPELAAARWRIKEATGRLNQAGRPSNPDIEVAIEPNTRFKEGRLEIGFSHRFPVTNRLHQEKEVSRAEVRIAEAEVREAERQLVGQARGLIIKILANRERRKLVDEQSRLAAKFAGLLADTAAKGEGSPLDAGQVRLEAATLLTELHQLDAVAAGLLGELKPLLGLEAGTPVEVGGELPAPAFPEDAVEPARRPDYLLATFQADAAANRLSLEQSRRREDIEGGFFAAAERSEDVPEGFDTEAIIGLRLKIPLPLWNKNEGAIEEAAAAHQRRKLETVALERAIRLEAESTRAEMRQWKHLLDETESTLLPLAEEQTKLAETAYSNGQGEIQAVLRAREKRLQLAAAKLDALREFHLARVRHQMALGRP